MRSTHCLTMAALIGGVYVVLCYFGNIFGLTFGTVQFRFAEALTVLPFLCPSAAAGLFVGCILANLLSPYGLLDLIVGSFATLLAGWLTARCKSRWQTVLPPTLVNALLVGAVITVQEVPFGSGFLPVYLYNAVSVGLGELGVCLLLGLPLLSICEKHGLLKENRRNDKK